VWSVLGGIAEATSRLVVGTGDNLNGHVVGARWPAIEIRQAMLEEAVVIIRRLWQGGYQDHHGRFFTVENARLYTRRSSWPPVARRARSWPAASPTGSS
jgi:coenzyme F420-dependent glucose-6-phosphate dehydrogenase